MKLPFTWTTFAESPCTALVSAVREVTVVVAPPAPPVVPPPWVAQPTSPVVGGVVGPPVGVVLGVGDGLLVGVVVGVDEGWEPAGWSDHCLVDTESQEFCCAGAP
ncbi:hypothetical protein AB0J37_37445, partial [Microbispora rosea]|uniref:hypothetical protein n=1 Tax=Microbispora rosea TaxID=58117 RepID=UPI003431653E